MHPIEHLRYLARTDSADAAGLVAETAVALGALGAEPANLVVAARRIIERHPSVAALWWLCAHILVSNEPRACAWRLADELGDDPTGDVLAAALPAGAQVVTAGLDRPLGSALAARPDVRATCVTADPSIARAATRASRLGVMVDVVDADHRTAVAEAVAVADLVLVPLMAGCPGRVLVGSGAAVVAASHGGVPLWLVAPRGACIPSRYVDAIADAVPEATTIASSEIAQVITPDGPAVDVAAALASSAPMAPELLRAVGAH